MVTAPSINNSGHTDAFSGCLNMPLMLYGGAHRGTGIITAVRVVNSMGSGGMMLMSSVMSATKAVAGTTGVVLRTKTGSIHTVTDRYMVSSPTSFHMRRSTLARVMFASDVPCSGGYSGIGRLDVTSVFTRAVGQIVGGRSVDSRCVVWPLHN